MFSWGGNPGVGSLHRLRDAVEHGWPCPLALEEFSHGAMANAYDAGAANLPFAALRTHPGGLADVNPRYRTVTCPFTGETLVAVPALRPDVTIIHAQKADREGNVLIEGIIGVQKEAVLAARRAVVTVEEVVDSFEGAASQRVHPAALDDSAQSPSCPAAHFRRTPSATTRATTRSIEAGMRSHAPATVSRAWLDEHVMRSGPEAFAARGRRVA